MNRSVRGRERVPDRFPRGGNMTQLVAIPMLLGSLGFQELLLIFLIVLVIFGSTKLPALGRGLGEGIRNFKRGLKTDDPPALEERRADDKVG
jgi:sec-independent protein translocase protein TatA